MVGPQRAGASTAGKTTYTFAWEKPSFPGTIIAGQFSEASSNPGGVALKIYFKPNHKQYESAYADTAGREFQYFTLQYGAAPAPRLNAVELPNDTLPLACAPDIAAISARGISEKTN